MSLRSCLSPSLCPLSYNSQNAAPPMFPRATSRLREKLSPRRSSRPRVQHIRYEVHGGIGEAHCEFLVCASPHHHSFDAIGTVYIHTWSPPNGGNYNCIGRTVQYCCIHGAYREEHGQTAEIKVKLQYQVGSHETEDAPNTSATSSDVYLMVSDYSRSHE